MTRPGGSLPEIRILRLFGLTDVPAAIRPLIAATAVQGLAMSGFSAYVVIWAVSRLHASAGAVIVAFGPLGRRAAPRPRPRSPTRSRPASAGPLTRRCGCCAACR